MLRFLLSVSLFTFLVAPQISFSQDNIPENIQIGPIHTSGFQPCEPSIAISPLDPQIVVAGSILDNVYNSTDGGKTWNHQQLTSQFGVYGDPCVVASPTGDFYYLHLSDPEGKGWSSNTLLDRIVCQHSTDGGVTWSKGGGMGLSHPKDQDKEWAVVSADGSTIYACWTQFDKYDSREPQDSTIILCSSAGRKANNWSTPVRISERAGNCLDSDATTEGAVPSISPDGTLYVAWALHETIWFDRSTDGGKTWLTSDIAATSIIGGWDQQVSAIGRVNGMPVTAVDLDSTSPHYGRIYINWTDARNGDDDLDVFLCYSDDDGDTWSSPVRVNDDGPGSQQFFTWMSVDPFTGGIHIVFYDRRSHTDETTNVYVASSFDGGETFTNLLVSESPFLPQGTVFFGDYNNISAVDGHVRPIWTREDNNVLTIWTALIDFTE